MFRVLMCRLGIAALQGHRDRVAKVMDQKSIGLCRQGLESLRCRPCAALLSTSLRMLHNAITMLRRSNLTPHRYIIEVGCNKSHLGPPVSMAAAPGVR